MPPRRSGPIDDFLAELVKRDAFPGAVYACGRPGACPSLVGALGLRAMRPEREPNDVQTLYDLASLTKALLTAPLALRLAECGVVGLDDPVSNWLPELDSYAGCTPTMRDLLLHRAGLPSWRPLYRVVSSREELPEALGGLEPVSPSGARAEYGCLGYIAAGLILERAAGSPFRELCRSEVLSPAGLAPHELVLGPVPRQRCTEVAPTERGRQREHALAGALARRSEVVPGPSVVLRGQTHDGNAAFLGGAAGNAGAFGTATAVFRLASSVAFSGGLLGAGAIAQLRLPWAGVSATEWRTLGFQSGRDPGAPSGAFGPDSFGHTGFTGTSVWIAPDPPLVAVLLTNRVHPVWREAPVQAWRREFHDLVVRECLGNRA